MQDLFPIPSCFSSSSSSNSLFSSTNNFPPSKLGQNIIILIYRTKTAGRSTLITITWCRNLLARGFSVSVNTDSHTNICKVEMSPWHFWRRHGNKRFATIKGNEQFNVIWDLRNAKFCNEDHSSPEPLSDYYVAVVSNNEVVLLLGDLKMEACRRIGSAAIIEAMLVSKKEHIFGKKRFFTRAKLGKKGRLHEVSIECDVSSPVLNREVEMVIKIDGMEVVHVRHLQWKFRGNEIISLSKLKVEVYWDVYGWLFSPGGGSRHGLFIFKPTMKLQSSSSTSSLSSLIGENGCSTSSYTDFCLFLHAWKVE